MPGRISNFIIKAIVNSPFHGVLGDSVAIIHVTGRKTGKVFAIPVNVAREGEAMVVVSRKSRMWWRNLPANPRARLRVGGRDLGVYGEVVEGREEVVGGLRRYIEQHPGYARHFGVRLDESGRPIAQDMERVAEHWVIVRLRPLPAGGRT